MRHEDYKELLALDALDLLEGDGDERRALDAHLAECDDCRAEASALRDSAASLAYAAPPTVAPAPELRARILASVKSQTRADARPLAPPTHGGAITTLTTTPPEVSNVSTSDEFARRREAREVRVSRRLLTFGTLAASLAVAALLVSLLLLWQRNERQQAEIARLSQAVNRTERDLARLSAERELLAAPAAQTATLAGTKMAERARARLTFDERTGRAMLMAADLPPAPAGKAYQLWFIAAGKPPMPGSVFQTDASGHAEMHDIVPPEGRRAAIYAVTLEPAGGVAAPTGEMYLKSSAS
ncbi:MAG TPA: anti-sigma factor [Pyrinomonadaceae bacterium]|nr:anti-sigma factor [Pyrinomonadaceae bacterium]